MIVSARAFCGPKICSVTIVLINILLYHVVKIGIVNNNAPATVNSPEVRRGGKER